MKPEDAYYLMTTIAFPIGAVWALLQWYAAVKQRKGELRWKQAEAAWKLMDEVFEHPDTRIALDLIDGELDSIDVPGIGEVPVTRDDALKALDLDDPDHSPAARMIRNSFNAVLYAFDRLETAISSGYILEEDARSPTLYYSRLLYALWSVLEPYARAVGYDRSLSLISRLGKS